MGYKNGFNSGLITDLPPGNYTVMPTTYDRGEEGDYAIRIFEEREQKVEYSYADGTLSRGNMGHGTDGRRKLASMRNSMRFMNKTQTDHRNYNYRTNRNSRQVNLAQEMS